MHFYLCLHEEAQEGPLESFRWDHCCIPHYWLWDLAQSGRIPSHITVQRLGLMFKKKNSGALFPSLQTDKPCLSRGVDKTAYCLRKKTNYIGLQISILYPVTDTNSWKWVLRKSRCQVPAEMCQFDFEGFKALNASSPSDSQEKVFHPCVSWAVTHFKNTHTAPVQSIQGPWTRGRRLQVTQKQQCPSSGCLFEGNRPPLIPTRTFMWSVRSVCVWLMAALWAQMTPCLRVNRTAIGAFGPSVLPISVNTN